MLTSVPVLSVPALLLAGLAASPHCAAMCGALSVQALRGVDSVQRRNALLALHGGRIAGYAILGAVAGATGQSLLRHLPPAGLGHWLQLLSALALAFSGLMLIRQSRNRSCCTPVAPNRSLVRNALRGLMWALMPCGLLYSMLLLATFSARADTGALLLGAFALGGTPLLAGLSWGGGYLIGNSGARRAGGVLVATGLTAALLILTLPAFGALAWCLPR